MENIFFLILFSFLILYGLANLLFLNAKEAGLTKLNRRVYLVAIFVSVIASGIIIIRYWEFKYYQILLLLLYFIGLNPLLIIFPFSNINGRMGARMKNILSKLFLIGYGFLLAVGLLGMTSPGNTWGNSALFFGILITFWALPNILLATLMTTDYRFNGIVRICLGIIVLLVIIFTIKSNDYTGRTEDMIRPLAGIICFYIIAEGYFYLVKAHNAAE